MAIPSGILELPNVRPSGVTFGLRGSTGVFQSPLSGATQTIRNPGSSWGGSISWLDVREGEARLLRSFLTKLDGQSGRFWCGDLSYEIPSGDTLTNSQLSSTNWTATLTSNGSVNLNSSNNLANGTRVLEPGDYFALYYRYNATDYIQTLHSVQIATSASSNSISVNFSPNIRINPQSGQTPRAYIRTDITQANITRTNAVVPCRLVSDDTQWSVRSPNFHSLQISFMEAF